jgi:chemotaxis protein MotB
MARVSRSHRRVGHGGHQEEGNGERWLLTYSDMITLLMALFMVLFSISSVNISKYRTLQQALRAAFSGTILPSGGKSIAQPSTASASSRASATAGAQSIAPLTGITPAELENAPGSEASGARSPAAASAPQTLNFQSSASREQEEFSAIKQRLEAYAARHGFSQHVHIAIERRGLVIQVLTDSVLFASGSAALDPQGHPLLNEIAKLLQLDRVHPVAVEGNTDDVPIHTAAFPSNWELSTARASTVVRFLIGFGVDQQRLSAAGFAELRPLASNSDPAGRARNRRVAIVLQRLY